MMRYVFWLATIAFWLGLLGYGLAARQMALQSPGQDMPATSETPATATTSRRPDVPVAIPADLVTYRLDELARHASAQDCWLAIDGLVYELTDYLDEHPAPAGAIEAWCGREASRAYHTKQRGRAHSALADRLLADFLRGRLQQP